MPKSKKESKPKATKKLGKPKEELVGEQVLDPNDLIPEPQEREMYLGKADRMKKHLSEQEKVSIIIPLGRGEKPGESREHVQINGYIIEYEGKPGLPKGMYISVPKQVAEAINNAYNIPQIAGQNLRVDRDTKVSEALS